MLRYPASSAVLTAFATEHIDSVEVFDITSEHVPLSKVRDVVLVSDDLDQHAAWLAEYLDLGFDELFLHQTGSDPGMPKPRYAVESWFFGGSAFPVEYSPLTV